MEIQPDRLAIGERYKFMIGTIVPRPIAFVSTVSTDSEGNRPNIAPFSFFNGVGSNPMTLLFCPGNNPDGSEKDTLRNCKPKDEGGTGELVVNLAVEGYAREVAAAAEPLPHGESEFDFVDLETAASVAVRPPRLARSPVAYECETLQVIRTNPGEPAGGNVVLGRVVHLYVDDAVIDERMRVDPRALQAIGRMAGSSYVTTRNRFELPRGRTALDLPPPEFESSD